MTCTERLALTCAERSRKESKWRSRTRIENDLADLANTELEKADFWADYFKQIADLTLIKYEYSSWL
ncbi:hypothetical protein NIES4072_24560 [Nostoc commune NIES-4072]|uniref:Uncharacterized protein n=1 Tax=Nostoc commune NIES-4072 TaxID=2005467 RepID=A0A2R5FSJ8_NOSCO|nr:hypothetical protein [Nostoc commune]BBD63888.1 hypothetical protein NIES4070_02300 [Nostoc commune HK-02]GBG18791.1 hypothetical protein NIES4072_24560 [Nostoc commune NIES-4072]